MVDMKMMLSVHVFLDDTRVTAPLMMHLPRTGDTMRFNANLYGKVTEVIWCMDESLAAGQRINLRVESFDASVKEVK
jgi:hypothetical protein